MINWLAFPLTGTNTHTHTHTTYTEVKMLDLYWFLFVFNNGGNIPYHRIEYHWTENGSSFSHQNLALAGCCVIWQTGLWLMDLYDWFHRKYISIFRSLWPPRERDTKSMQNLWTTTAGLLKFLRSASPLLQRQFVQWPRLSAPCLLLSRQRTRPKHKILCIWGQRSKGSNVSKEIAPQSLCFGKWRVMGRRGWSAAGQAWVRMRQSMFNSISVAFKRDLLQGWKST